MAAPEFIDAALAKEFDPELAVFAAHLHVLRKKHLAPLLAADLAGEARENARSEFITHCVTVAMGWRQLEGRLGLGPVLVADDESEEQDGEDRHDQEDDEG
jgi:hypothetical protein